MALLILLIVLTFLVALLLGLVGFFKAQAAGLKINALEDKLHKLSIELKDTRSLALRLYDAYRTGEREAPGEQETASGAMPAVEPVEQPHAEQHEVEPEPEVDEPVVEDQPTTLQHLLDLRRQKQPDEQLVEGSPEQAEPEG